MLLIDQVTTVTTALQLTGFFRISRIEVYTSNSSSSGSANSNTSNGIWQGSSVA
jgi:hypothetical protein